IDTGAMYRAVALHVLRTLGTDYTEQDVVGLLPDCAVAFVHQDGKQLVCLNGEVVEEQIRTMEVGKVASEIAQIKAVRQLMVKNQQQMGEQKGIVMDGRDIGTVVFPQAELKIFLTASVEVRVQRRYDELLQKGVKTTIEAVKQDLLQRDYNDTHRAVDPLRKATDAIEVDNSKMTLEEQKTYVANLFEQCVSK
ncbi:MAG: (d)CMP kinase, partial [Paludibacteraceae bacterium]|nr:(d)CMP kinase [Paludibacteraceae bacterium]